MIFVKLENRTRKDRKTEAAYTFNDPGLKVPKSRDADNSKVAAKSDEDARTLITFLNSFCLEPFIYPPHSSHPPAYSESTVLSLHDLSLGFMRT